MSDDQKVELAPEVALARFLTAIQNQADVDPRFRNTLLLALGANIVFSGEDDLTTIEPHIVAARKDELSFRAIYSKLAAPKLRSILTKNGLASATDLRGKSAPQMLDVLWSRSIARAEERGLLS